MLCALKQTTSQNRTPQTNSVINWTPDANNQELKYKDLSYIDPQSRVLDYCSRE